MPQPVAKPYKIEHSELLGRYLVASRDLKAGEVILKEQPLVLGPRADSTPVCVACYAPMAPPHRRCSRCRVAPVCSSACETAGEHTETECDVLRRVADAPPTPVAVDILNNYQLLLPLRCLLLRQSHPAKWEVLTTLEAHMDERRDSPVWRTNHMTVVKVLRSWGLLTPADDDDTVQQVCGVCDVNSFEVRGPFAKGSPLDPERLRGVYPEAALMAHDCIGNTHLAVDDHFQMTIHASLPIPAEAPIYFNYTHALQGTEDRREHLREGKYFECSCPRCVDPSELGTHLSSINCVRCHVGVIARVTRAEWRCLKCAHGYKPCLMASTVSMARHLLNDTDRRDPRAMEALLKKLLRSFPPTHAILLELKQNLIALYRDIILRDPSYSRKILHRKTELCRQLLPVLEVIEPGISRLRAITFYELHVPLVLLANREYQIGEISSAELLTRLKEAEGYLRDAVTQLVYEPPHSPEGQLARVAMQELRGLRSNMQDVQRLADAQPTSRRQGNTKKNNKRNK